MYDYHIVVVYQDVMWEKTKNLTLAQDLVFRFLVSRLSFGNIVYQKTTDIARECGIARPNISKALWALQDEDLIVKLRRGEYMINPVIVRKGDNKHGEITAKYLAARKAVA